MKQIEEAIYMGAILQAEKAKGNVLSEKERSVIADQIEHSDTMRRCILEAHSLKAVKKASAIVGDYKDAQQTERQVIEAVVREAVEAAFRNSIKNEAREKEISKQCVRPFMLKLEVVHDERQKALDHAKDDWDEAHVKRLTEVHHMAYLALGYLSRLHPEMSEEINKFLKERLEASPSMQKLIHNVTLEDARVAKRINSLGILSDHRADKEATIEEVLRNKAKSSNVATVSYFRLAPYMREIIDTKEPDEARKILRSYDYSDDEINELQQDRTRLRNIVNYFELPYQSTSEQVLYAAEHARNNLVELSRAEQPEPRTNRRIEREVQKQIKNPMQSILQDKRFDKIKEDMSEMLKQKDPGEGESVKRMEIARQVVAKAAQLNVEYYTHDQYRIKINNSVRYSIAGENACNVAWEDEHLQEHIRQLGQQGSEEHFHKRVADLVTRVFDKRAPKNSAAFFKDRLPKTLTTIVEEAFLFHYGQHVLPRGTDLRDINKFLESQPWSMGALRRLLDSGQVSGTCAAIEGKVKGLEASNPSNALREEVRGMIRDLVKDAIYYATRNGARDRVLKDAESFPNSYQGQRLQMLNTCIADIESRAGLSSDTQKIIERVQNETPAFENRKMESGLLPKWGKYLNDLVLHAVESGTKLEITRTVTDDCMRDPVLAGDAAVQNTKYAIYETQKKQILEKYQDAINDVEKQRATHLQQAKATLEEEEAAADEALKKVQARHSNKEDAQRVRHLEEAEKACWARKQQAQKKYEESEQEINEEYDSADVYIKQRAALADHELNFPAAHIERKRVAVEEITEKLLKDLGNRDEAGRNREKLLQQQVLKVHARELKTGDWAAERVRYDKEITDQNGRIADLTRELVLAEANKNRYNEEIRKKELNLNSLQITNKGLIEDLKQCIGDISQAEKDGKTEVKEGLRGVLDEIHKSIKSVELDIKDIRLKTEAIRKESERAELAYQEALLKKEVEASTLKRLVYLRETAGKREDAEDARISRHVIRAKEVMMQAIEINAKERMIASEEFKLKQKIQSEELQKKLTLQAQTFEQMQKIKAEETKQQQTMLMQEFLQKQKIAAACLLARQMTKAVFMASFLGSPQQSMQNYANSAMNVAMRMLSY